MSFPTDVKVVDADSHLTPVADLWTSRAPAKYKDRILHVEKIDGVSMWVNDGEVLYPERGGGVIDRDGKKYPFHESMTLWSTEEVCEGAYDTNKRLEVLDESGISHQVLFPNSIGLGGQDLGTGKGPMIKQLCVEIYNDARRCARAPSARSWAERRQSLPALSTAAWSPERLETGFALKHVTSADDVRHHLAEDGAVVIDDVLAPEQVASLRGLLDEEIRRDLAPGILFRDQGDCNERLLAIVARHKAFRDLIEHPLSTAIASAWLKPRYRLSSFGANASRRARRRCSSTPTRSTYRRPGRPIRSRST